jgi:copper chaperone CopZ
MKFKVVKIEGMSCKHCAATVEKALRAVMGVDSVSVELEKNEAVVETNGGVSDEAIIKAVADAGYRAISIE